MLGRVRPGYRRTLQAGLAFSGMVTLVALPVVLGFGHRRDDASVLPLPYLRNLLLVLAAAWLLLVMGSLRRSRWGARGAVPRR